MATAGGKPNKASSTSAAINTAVSRPLRRREVSERNDAGKRQDRKTYGPGAATLGRLGRALRSFALDRGALAPFVPGSGEFAPFVPGCGEFAPFAPGRGAFAPFAPHRGKLAPSMLSPSALAPFIPLGGGAAGLGRTLGLLSTRRGLSLDGDAGVAARLIAGPAFDGADLAFAPAQGAKQCRGRHGRIEVPAHMQVEAIDRGLGGGVPAAIDGPGGAPETQQFKLNRADEIDLRYRR